MRAVSKHFLFRGEKIRPFHPSRPREAPGLKNLMATRGRHHLSYLTRYNIWRSREYG
ncbi:hypothetical protein TIFTF001_028231 [Ficus carica]|uniref:Uncharacterized protein n=1 Tax=Ficus carica TaxID=3494 RepID=A0AA88J0X7_FICCA|nr:hypothetical protein TIFTF001_028231 [Ficus carica]